LLIRNKIMPNLYFRFYDDEEEDYPIEIFNLVRTDNNYDFPIREKTFFDLEEVFEFKFETNIKPFSPEELEEIQKRIESDKGNMVFI